MNLSSSLPGMKSAEADRATASRAIKDLVRKHLGLDPDAAVFVAEIACGEIECPDRETVIAVFRSGARTEFRLHKAILEITGADIVAAVPAAT